MHLPQLQREQRSADVLQLRGSVDAVAAKGYGSGGGSGSVGNTRFGSWKRGGDRQGRRRRCFGVFAVFPRDLVVGSGDTGEVPRDEVSVGSEELVGDESK